MRPTDRFSLQALPKRHPAKDFRRRLLLDGHPTNTVVEGDEIAEQFACGELFLLITSFDYYNATSHWFYVLDGQGRVKDRAATPDRVGFVAEIAIAADSRLSFGFSGTDERWTLILKERGVWSFTAADLARRAGWFLLRKRYLSLSREAGEPAVTA